MYIPFINISEYIMRVAKIKYRPFPADGYWRYRRRDVLAGYSFAFCVPGVSARVSLFKTGDR